jgi:tetratricopeptide (TPR) repeat protein
MDYKNVKCESCGRQFEIGAHIQTYSCNECGHIHMAKETAAALMSRDAPIEGEPSQENSGADLDIERLDEAERYCLQAEFILHKLQANVSVYGTNSGWTCPDPADVELALKYINRSLEIWPDSSKYLNLKALFLMEGMGDREAGIALLEKAAKLAPDDITLQDNLEKSKTQQQCFIATAAFSEDAWEVRELRNWRDTRLLPNPAGRSFVRLYYKMSPSLGRWLRKKSILRMAVRATLRPIARSLRQRRVR